MRHNTKPRTIRAPFQRITIISLIIYTHLVFTLARKTCESTAHRRADAYP
jgi:hypothetical protein